MYMVATHVNLESMCVRHHICNSACDMTFKSLSMLIMSSGRATEIAPTIIILSAVRDVQNTIEAPVASKCKSGTQNNFD